MIIKIAPEGVETTRRFFLALETLQSKRVIRGLNTFTSKYGINYWNMNTLKSEPERRVLKSECVRYGDETFTFPITVVWQQSLTG